MAQSSGEWERHSSKLDFLAGTLEQDGEQRITNTKIAANTAVAIRAALARVTELEAALLECRPYIAGARKHAPTDERGRLCRTIDDLAAARAAGGGDG